MRALEVVDVNDWQFSPDFFAELDAEFGPCSRDACCDSFKSNAFCPVSWNKSDNALLQDWRTLLVWCNGPFDLLFELLTVFLRAKWRQPVATSALFVVPVWAERPFYALLLRAGSAGVMRRVRSYPLGTQLFTKPVSRLEGGGRLAVRGAPWPVEVWFAPPTVPPPARAYAATRSRTGVRRRVTAGPPARSLSCRCGGRRVEYRSGALKA